MRLIIASLLTSAFASTLMFAPEQLANLGDIGKLSQIALYAVSGYFLIEGIIGLKVQKQPEPTRVMQTAHDDFLHLREETDQLAAIVRESKEREHELLAALEELREQSTEAQRQLAEASPQHDEVISLLSLLQSRGRFLDFVSQDVSKYDDAHIGRVARYVQQGCSAVMSEHFEMARAHDSNEGSQFTITNGYDPRSIRFSGRVPERPPFAAKLIHRGWKVLSVKLPKIIPISETEADRIIAPAEAEVIAA